MEILIETASVYSGGGVPAFEARLQSQIEMSRLSFGAETFAGVSKWAGFDPESRAAYKERVDIGDGLSTNVYTVLRPLASDFGVAGAILFWAIGSLLAAWCYRNSIRAASVTSSIFVVLWMAFCFFSGTTSMFTFSNVTLGLLFGSLMAIRWFSFSSIDELGGAGSVELQERRSDQSLRVLQRATK